MDQMKWHYEQIVSVAEASRNSLVYEYNGRSMKTLRFVILLHQVSMGDHWDVMLETESALTTWSIPPQCLTGVSFACLTKRLSDHRKHYLDYEGNVTGNRGLVSRIDAGTYDQLLPEKFVLHGKIFSGTLTINGTTMIFESCNLPYSC